ncbi:hypothetical protein ACB092_05G225800 [Castanea dentata]
MLSRLHVKSLMRFLYWYQNHLSFPYHRNNRFGKAVEIYLPLVRPRKMTNIVGYCDGLVCILDSKTIATWNPLIKKYKKLPREPIQKSSSFGNGDYCYSMFAFGHDPHKDDYKVVRIVEFVGSRYMETEVKIYSLKSQAWKKVDERWKDVEKHLPNKLPVILSQILTTSLNGAEYWLIVPSGGYPKPELELQSILAFDIVNEKMRVYKTPVQPKNDDNILNTSLGVLGGCLCFVVNVQNAKDMYYEVWLMKEYGVESSWTKVYKIEKGAMPEAFWSIEPLIFSRNGKKVLFQGIHFGCVKFIWYDVEKKRGKSVKIQNLPAMFALSVTSIGSLLLLDVHNTIHVNSPPQTQGGCETNLRLSTKVRKRPLGCDLVKIAAS